VAKHISLISLISRQQTDLMPVRVTGTAEQKTHSQALKAWPGDTPHLIFNDNHVSFFSN
jgi:hypothetical protein